MRVSKPLLVLDQHFRTLDELFDAETFRALGALCDIEGGENAPMARARLSSLMKDATFLVAARPALSADDIAQAPHLRAVVEVSGAFHGELDYQACLDRGIEILSCAPGFRFAVAEMGLAMLLGAGRGLVAEHEALRTGEERWLDDRPASDFTLFSQRIGFVGYGNIAREMHRLLAPFDPQICAFDPWLDRFPDGVTRLSLADLFRTCRAIVVTAVPSGDNKGLVDAGLIDAMPPGAAMVLLSRAHVIDFNAAVAAARAGRITFATDVFPTEPVLPDDPVRAAANLILSPHRAAAVRGGRRAIGRFILHDLRAILSGAPERTLTKADAQRVAGLVQAQSDIERAGRLPNT